MYQPTRDEFCAMSKRGNLVPVYREILADMETPVSAFKKLRTGPYAFLLESVEGGENVARYSFLGTEPRLVFRSKGRQVWIEEGDATSSRELEDNKDPLHYLKGLLQEYRFAPLPDLPRFCGGAVGYMSYDMVRFFEDIGNDSLDDLDLPDCLFLLTDSLLIFDHVKHKIKVLADVHVTGDPGEAYDEACRRIDALVGRLRMLAPNHDGPRSSPAHSSNEISSTFTKEGYLAVVRRAKEYVAAGDIIQVVPSQRLSTTLTAEPFDVYRALRSVNPSPYMYYLALRDLTIVGSSPEILVTEDNGLVRTRPIAGTRRRGTTSAEDAALERELLADEKELAEHIMLVDLGRNDLGRVSEYGTVHVDELMAVERYSHVMHICSDVTGRLRDDCDQFDVLRACFPAGTVSGAPKVRAMQIIEELEPTRRGPYAGAIGYFSYSGNMDTCITIRTLVVKGSQAFVQVGGGVVADSDPESEYQETINKAKAMLRAVELAEAGLD